MQMSCLKWCFAAKRGAVNDVSKQSQLPGNSLYHWPISRAANWLCARIWLCIEISGYFSITSRWRKVDVDAYVKLQLQCFAGMVYVTSLGGDVNGSRSSSQPCPLKIYIEVETIPDEFFIISNVVPGVQQSWFPPSLLQEKHIFITCSNKNSKTTTSQNSVDASWEWYDEMIMSDAINIVLTFRSLAFIHVPCTD